MENTVSREPRACPNCGRVVYLNRDGLYRRHYAVEQDGRRHLCAVSGRESAMPRAS